MWVINKFCLALSSKRSRLEIERLCSFAYGALQIWVLLLLFLLLLNWIKVTKLESLSRLGGTRWSRVKLRCPAAVQSRGIDRSDTPSSHWLSVWRRGPASRRWWGRCYVVTWLTLPWRCCHYSATPASRVRRHLSATVTGSTTTHHACTPPRPPTTRCARTTSKHASWWLEQTTEARRRRRLVFLVLHSWE